MENHSLIERIKNGDGDDALKEIYNSYRESFMLDGRSEGYFSAINDYSL